MLFGTNNVTIHKKENAKRERMQGESKTGTIPLSLQRILRQWDRERETAENTKSKEQLLAKFYAKYTVNYEKIRLQIRLKIRLQIIQKKR